MRSLLHCQNRGGKLAEWSPLVCLGVSAVVCLGLFIRALSLGSTGTSNQKLVVRVYCASAVVEPMNKIVDQFNASKLATTEKMVVDIVRSGGSGALAGQINTEALTGVQYMVDIFVCADSNRMSELVDRNVIDERFPIAAQFPVIAVRDNPDLNLKQVNNLRSLLNLEIKLGIGSISSAIGYETDRVAKLQGCRELLQTHKTADFENVMSLAQALSLGSIDAAVIWDSTVIQLNRTNSQPIKIVAYLNSEVTTVEPTSQNPHDNEALATGNLPPESRSDKFSVNKSTRSALSKCFVEVGRSKSTSLHADLFFKYLKDNHNKLLNHFVDAGFSKDLSEALPR